MRANSDTQKEKSNNQILDKRNQMHDMSDDMKHLFSATTQCLLNPSLIIPFFYGPIYRQVPHVRSFNPLGHLRFTSQKADALTAAALKTSNGIATFWMGPFPVLYVVSNEARHILVRESHIGIINEESADYLHWLSRGNHVMTTFPDFRSIESETYKIQRRFLMNRFHGGANQRLSEIEKTAIIFLKNYYQKNVENSCSLRELITALVLHTSSYLLGLTQHTLDNLYFESVAYRNAIDNVAQYGISKRINVDLEQTLYDFFVKTCERNFDQIFSETSEVNLIKNIFDSMNVDFPKEWVDFYQLPKNIRHAIAMNFASTGLGAMVHSTANTLDWAMARLLKEHHRWHEFQQLMLKFKNIDLTQEGVFDKAGPLFPIGEWVLHNVFLYPPFSHEFFLNRQSSDMMLPDGSTINIPRDSFIVVNYTQCNRSEIQMRTLNHFSESLHEKSTTSRFILDERVASFGGSKVNKENNKTRICPGAKTSLYEQMIMIAILIRDYSLELTDSKEISCEVDLSKHPLCARVNSGNVILKQSSHSIKNDKEIDFSLESIKKIDLKECQDANKEYTYSANVNSFFNRVKMVASSCDSTTAKKLLCRSATMGAALALHVLHPY